MNQADFTPPPWTLHFEECSRGGNKGKQILTGIMNMQTRQSVMYPNWVLDREGDVWQAWIVCKEADRALVAAAPAMFEALTAIVAVWERQCGRVFESMGSDNPRALAIEEAIMAGKEVLKMNCPKDGLTNASRFGRVDKL